MDNNKRFITEEQSVFMTDEMYIPIYFKGVVVSKPVYNRSDLHTIEELEQICEQFNVYIQQQQIVKQNCMKHLVELKFGISLPNYEE